MTDHDRRHDDARTRPQDPAVRTRFERLRERTDEIELIISGLTTFALFALPGWIMERYADAYVHLPDLLGRIVNLVVTLGIGACYTLGSVFLLHLLVRSYWVGLIGLKVVFPHGPRWERIPGTGPIGRQMLRERVGDLDSAITGADRFGSLLFSVISLTALLLLWVAAINVVMFALAGVVASGMGSSDQVVRVVGLSFVGGVLAVSMLVWVLDAVLAARYAAVREHPGVVAVVRGARRAMGWVIPERLIANVQLTLASNTRPQVFVVVMMVGMIVALFIGEGYMRQYRTFSSSGDYRHLDAEAVAGGYHSAHYENMRTPADRLHPLPMIPSDVVEGEFLRLFLPYFPRRDDPRLQRLCTDRTGPDCLRQSWQVELNGQRVALDAFEPAQRRELGLRGLLGWIALDALEPGPQRLRIRRLDSNGSGADDVDEIPFLYAPTAASPPRGAPPRRVDVPQAPDPPAPSVADPID